jgi:hypothetical protein
MSIDVMSRETQRVDLVRRGRYLEYFTIAYNSLEGLIAVGAGLIAGCPLKRRRKLHSQCRDKETALKIIAIYSPFFRGSSDGLT